ncbi:MAG: type II toxin-antitoxin system VapC family toxin [Pseudomonadota bacterium]
MDTNVLVRYLTQDDPIQSARATEVLEETIRVDNPGYVGLVVLAEMVRVLQRAYRATNGEVEQTVVDLLQCRELIIEKREVVRQALSMAGNAGGSFVDALIAVDATNAGCDRVYTFDRRATQVGMTLASS